MRPHCLISLRSKKKKSESFRRMSNFLNMMNRSKRKSNITNVRTVAINGRNGYFDILESAWRAHLAPRESDAPTLISTFAGGGGSSLGYSMAGFRELLAVEWDDNAVETFKRNFPSV